MHAPGDVQEIEVRGFAHPRQASHHHPGSKQWQVEALPIERDEQRSLLDTLANALEHRRLLPQLPHEDLLEHERSIRVPRSQPYQERYGSGAAREASRFRVEKKRATHVASGERRIERQKGEKLDAGVVGRPELGSPGAMRAGETLLAHVKQPRRDLRRFEREVVDGSAPVRRVRAARSALEGRPNSLSEPIDHLRPRHFPPQGREGTSRELVAKGHGPDTIHRFRSLGLEARSYSSTLESPSAATASISSIPIANLAGRSPGAKSFESTISRGLTGRRTGTPIWHRTTTVTP